MSGAFSVPLTFAAIYLQKAPLKLGFACLAALGVVGACYQVWRDSVIALQAEIATRDGEIERLKHRPYDDEHRRLAERKVNALTDAGKDLVYFLLHHGEIESNELERHCQNPTYYNEAIQRPREGGLVIATARPIAGRSSVHYFWSINPEFRPVLQDLLGKRVARYFL
jgi:hypothetical protein